jgi:hypothetical protein
MMMATGLWKVLGLVVLLNDSPTHFCLSRSLEALLISARMWNGNQLFDSEYPSPRRGLCSLSDVSLGRVEASIKVETLMEMANSVFIRKTAFVSAGRMKAASWK